MAEYVVPLLVFAPTLALVRRFGYRVTARIAVGLVVTTIALIPLGEASAVTYLRGIVGDLSITSVVLLLYWASTHVKQTQINASQNLIACSVIGATGVLFYPTATGFGTFDPYTLGYEPLLLSGIAATLCLACIWVRWYLTATCTLAALIVYQLQGLPSHNLWDYLIDPLLVVFSLGYVGVKIWRRYRETPRSA